MKIKCKKKKTGKNGQIFLILFYDKIANLKKKSIIKLIHKMLISKKSSSGGEKKWGSV